MSTLAVDGGTPVRTVPFPRWPFFAEDEIEAAAEVLRSGRSNYWTGDVARQFESDFAHLTGTHHAIAVANGTVALEGALAALGIGPGDEVVVPCRTFIASASCAVMRGAIPVMADVDRESQNLTAETIQRVLTPHTRAVIAVHLAGWPCDMDPILGLARQHGLWVIEDCAQALGARYKVRPVGSMGHAGTFSFCQDKIMTTAGEGGMLVTSDYELWKSAWALKDHGKSHTAAEYRSPQPEFRWLHDSFGTNWRMTEIQAAIGRVQLRKLPGWLARRRNNADQLTEALARIPALRTTRPPDGIEHSYYKYYAFVNPERLRSGWTRDRVANAITREGVPCFSGVCGEIYLEKAFQRMARRPTDRLPVARELGETSLMFLVHPTLEARDICNTIHATEKVLHVAQR